MKAVAQGTTCSTNANLVQGLLATRRGMFEHAPRGVRTEVGLMSIGSFPASLPLSSTLGLALQHRSNGKAKHCKRMAEQMFFCSALANLSRRNVLGQHVSNGSRRIIILTNRAREAEQTVANQR